MGEVVVAPQVSAPVPDVVALNRDIVRRSHLRPAKGGRNEKDCSYGCDLSDDQFCKRVEKVIADSSGLYVEVVLGG